MDRHDEKAREILDSWDVKHWGRKPIADTSRQYQTREDIIEMISAALRAEAERGERLAEALKKVRAVAEGDADTATSMKQRLNFEWYGKTADDALAEYRAAREGNR